MNLCLKMITLPYANKKNELLECNTKKTYIPYIRNLNTMISNYSIIKPEKINASVHFTNEYTWG